MKTKNTFINDVPLTLSSLTSFNEAALKGTILVLHGLGASKELQNREAELFAQHNYLSVAIDAVGHGDRKYVDYEQRFTERLGASSFREVVEQTRLEFAPLIRGLVANGWAVPGRVGAMGMSMGGAIILRALTDTIDLASAVCVNSPVGPEFLIEAERIQTSASLMLHMAERDVVSPIDIAREFSSRLDKRFQEGIDHTRFQFIEHPGEEHMMSEKAWDRVRMSSVRWFDKTLLS